MYLYMKGKLGVARRRIAALAALATAAATIIAVAPTTAALALDDVVFEGSGWGHGVGLSQYGAFGMAKVDGAAYQEILAHYFQGSGLTTVPELPDPLEPLWVNLAKDQESVTLIAREIKYATPPGPTATLTMTRGAEIRGLAIDDRLDIARIGEGHDCTVVHRNPSGDLIEDLGAGTCDLDLTWDGSSDQPTRKIEIEGCTLADWNVGTTRPCQYGRGSIVVRAAGPPADPAPDGPFDVSLIIDLEDYVLGISEMPYYWGNTANGGAEALKAQAVAARSYALAKQLARGAPGNNSCLAWCHVRDTTVDQRYVGWGHGWDEWTAAVEDTAGVLITHPGAPTSQQGIVASFYSSASGGVTENNSDVWGGSQLPYLVSVDDHWALLADVANGNTSWTENRSPTSVAGAVGLDTLTAVRVTAVYESGSVETVAFHGVASGQATVVTKTGTWVKSAFGLKSRYFAVDFGNAAPPSFDDIADTVHQGNIEYLRERGIALSCDAGPGQFCPNDFMQREDMAAFIARALDLPFVSGDAFVDDQGLTFEDDINRIAAVGITHGCNPPANDRFCPGESVTRGQMAAFLVRAFDLTEGSGTDRFQDDDSSIFESDIDRIAHAGITLGCNPPDNDRYCQNRFVTRAEMASFLARALRNVSG